MWFNTWEKIEAFTDDEKIKWLPILGCSNERSVLIFYIHHCLYTNSEFYKRNRFDILVGVTQKILGINEIGITVALDFVSGRFIALQSKL